MTTYVHRTMIVSVTLAPLARSLAVALAGPPADGMWTTPLAPAGAPDATHYVSAGMIEDTFADLIVDAAAMHAAYAESGGTELTLGHFQTLVAQSDVSTDDPFVAFERLGLQLLQETLDETR